MFALVLDDAELNNVLMAEAIEAIPGCVVREFTRPAEALAFVREHAAEIGVAITDYDMPGMNGLEFIGAARAVAGFEHVPILMVTGVEQVGLRREAVQAGTTDFLGKPFDPVEVKARVTNLLALNQARLDQQDRAAWLAREVASAVGVIEAREREIVTVLMKAAEHRDSDTGEHVARVAAYVALIAEQLGLEPAACRELSLASTMHDIGKLAIDDAILLKRGPLTPAERLAMQAHAERGSKILDGSTCGLLRRGAEIAASHHERWDGAGYPLGLLGEAAPLSGRIVAVADVFDALTSDRSYKNAWPIEEARAYLADNAGTQFDPVCVDAFLARWPEVLAILATHGPAPPPQGSPVGQGWA